MQDLENNSANNSLKKLHIIAFTHNDFSLSKIGKLHIEEENQKDALPALKSKIGLDELMFLSTCNRVEFIFVTDKKISTTFLHNFLTLLYPNLNINEREEYLSNSIVKNELEALDHILRVASSIDSMILGEREIIRQVRESFERSKENKLTGDFIRLLINHTIEVAKKVYTETNIAKRPVSIVSLAYKKLKEINASLNSSILIIGAGKTNTNMCKYLLKYGFKNFHVFNRTFSKAQLLAKEINGKPYQLNELKNFNEKFDIIITCTGSENHIITHDLYKAILKEDKSHKTIIDLAIPQDVSPEIVKNHIASHISIESLQKISNKNLKIRSKEIALVEEIISKGILKFQHINQVREIEIAMSSVPNKVKEIKSNAINDIFKNDLKNLDEDSRETLDKVVNYMEKKYISIPMLMAKDILIKKSLK